MRLTNADLRALHRAMREQVNRRREIRAVRIRSSRKWRTSSLSGSNAPMYQPSRPFISAYGSITRSVNSSSLTL